MTDLVILNDAARSAAESKDREILVLRVGNPDDELLVSVKEALVREVGFATSIDTSALDPAFAHHPERNQHHSTLLLHRIVERPAYGIILGVTEVDLYIPILTFVFGEAETKGRGAIVSYHRLHDEFYGLAANPGLLHERLIKEAIHEVGHVLGLVHCHDYRCVMAASHAVERIDTKSESFCDVCRALIQP